MKLVVEIGDHSKGEIITPWISSQIEPLDSREGISVHNKSGQTERLARLIDLSNAVNEAVKAFYQNRISSSPRAAINTSGEPGTK